MKAAGAVVVLFDQIERDDFFRRLEWRHLIRAWPGVVSCDRIDRGRVRLELAGVDGLATIVVARKRIGGKIFIGAWSEAGELIQTGVWSYDSQTGVAACIRRVHRLELLEALRRRLPEFCCATFLSDRALSPSDAA